MTEVGIRILYSAETQRSALPKGAIMHGSILVYGNEEMLVTTRCLILEKVGYRVFSAQTFGNAMLVLMNHQIDIVVLCQSLKDEERRGILETARALQPEIKCAVLDFEEREFKLNGVDLIQGLEGPTALLSAIGKLLTQKVTAQTQASN
jgi:two-component SAPR family response regulator